MKNLRILRVQALACTLLLSEITFAADSSTENDGSLSTSNSSGLRVRTRSQSLSGSPHRLPVPIPLAAPAPVRPAAAIRGHKRLYLTDDSKPEATVDLEHFSDKSVSEYAVIKSKGGRGHKAKNKYMNTGNKRSPFVAPLYPLIPSQLPTFEQESHDIRDDVQDTRLFHYAGAEAKVFKFQFSMIVPKGTITTFEPVNILGLVKRTDMRADGKNIRSPQRPTVTVVSITPERARREERKRIKIEREKREHAAALREAKQIERARAARLNPPLSPSQRPAPAPKRSYKLQDVFEREGLTITKACQLLGLNEDDVYKDVPKEHRGKAHHALTDTIMAQAVLEVLRQKELKLQQEELDVEESDADDSAPVARVPSTPTKFPNSPHIIDDEDEEDGRKPARKRRLSFTNPVLVLAPVAGAQAGNAGKKVRLGRLPTDQD